MSNLTRLTVDINITKDELSNFLSIIKEMCKISNTHKIKWEDKGILFYSIKGEDGEEKSQGKVNLLKSFCLDRTDLFSKFPDDINFTYTIKEAKKFAEKYSLLLDEDLESYKISIRYIDETKTVEFFKAVGNFYKSLSATAGDNGLVKDFNIQGLSERLDPDLCDNIFKVNIDDLKNIIKASKLDNENDLIDVSIENNEIVFSEGQYEINIDNVNKLDNDEFSFRKEYLKNIICHKDYDYVEFLVYPSYVVVNEHKSNLLFTRSL